MTASSSDLAASSSDLDPRSAQLARARGAGASTSTRPGTESRYENPDNAVVPSDDYNYIVNLYASFRFMPDRALATTTLLLAFFGRKQV